MGLNVSGIEVIRVIWRLLAWSSEDAFAQTGIWIKSTTLLRNGFA